MFRSLALFGLLFLALGSYAGPDPAATGNGNTRPLSRFKVPPRDSANVRTAKDSAAVSKSRADTVLVVKHQFNHREQIIGGSVMMVCLAGILVVMNNYNPR